MVGHHAEVPVLPGDRADFPAAVVRLQADSSAKPVDGGQP